MTDESTSEDTYEKELYKAYDYATTEFDKSLTYISSGILGVSFGFIDKIVPLAKAKMITKPILISGWYLLGIAIVLSSLAHLINIILIRIAIAYYTPVDDIYQKRIRMFGDIFIQLLNLATLILILLGSLHIISFIDKNI